MHIKIPFRFTLPFEYYFSISFLNFHKFQTGPMSAFPPTLKNLIDQAYNMSTDSLNIK